MSRFYSDEERDALDAAQAQLARDNARHERMRTMARVLITLTAFALAVIAALLWGRSMGGSP